MYIESTEAAIFDMDGTLLDSLGIWTDSDKSFVSGLGLDYDGSVSVALKKLHFNSACEYLKEYYGLSMSAGEIGGKIMEIVRHRYLHDALLKPYAKDYIERLHRLGVKMCVATSNERSLAEGALRNTGILDYMEFVITSDDVGEGKESPLIFLEAAEKLGKRPNEIYVFEDSLHAIISANSVCFHTVGVYEERFADEFTEIMAEAEYTIHSFYEIVL